MPRTSYGTYQAQENTGIVYRALPQQPSFFFVYVDASYGDADGRRSITGYVVLAGDGAIN